MYTINSTYNTKSKSHIQWLAGLLCALLVFTLIPAQWFHHHHEEEVCETESECTDNTPCHITLYHQHTPVEKCQHTGHYTAATEGCTFCYTAAHSPQQHYLQHAYTSYVVCVAKAQIQEFPYKNYKSVFPPAQTNKGPPVV